MLITVIRRELLGHLLSLRFALAWAAAGVTEYELPDMEIWVAEGTYTPISGTHRFATFQLAKGVEIYGGFAATETLRIPGGCPADPLRVNKSDFSTAKAVDCGPVPVLWCSGSQHVRYNPCREGTVAIRSSVAGSISCRSGRCGRRGF